MEINIKSMRAADWKKVKDELEGHLHTVAGYSGSRVVRVDPTVICIEGGGVPIRFAIVTGVMEVWNKCSRYSGGYCSIEVLRQIEYILQSWAAVNFPLD